MNAQTYLQRIHFTRPISISLHTLAQLQQAHLLHIPFGNLDIHNQIPIQLNTARIYDKVVTHRREGFCYELNGLFYELLKSLGFEVRRISTRVYNDGEYGPEYDHLAIVSTIDGEEYLADVGFGEFTFSPLLLNTTEPQHDARGIFRIDRYEEIYYRVSKQEDNRWKPVYIFENRHREFGEFEPMCRYHQTSPESHFTKNRLITRPTNNGRITLTDDTLRITQNGQPAQEKPVNGPEEFATYLFTWFEIR
jgi:N-hydroxyarylamine O-acetyltransferase